MKGNQGFTALELLVAVTIMGGLMLLGTQLFLGPRKQFEASTQRVSQEQLRSLATRRLVTELNSSSIMKSGLLAFDGKALGTTIPQCATATAGCTVPETSISLAATDGDGFSFAYSAMATVGAAGAANDALLVSDPAPFFPGALVQVSHLEDPSFAGIFSVSSITGNTLTLSSTVDVPSVFNASVTKASQTLLNLRTDKQHYVYGAAPSVFKLDLIQLVNYGVTVTDAVPGLYRSSWPTRNNKGTALANPLKQLLFKPFLKLDLTAEWAPANPTQAGDRAGRWSGAIEITYELGNSKVTDKQHAFASYGVDATRQRNFAVITQGAPDTTAFPTCSINLASQAGSFTNYANNSALYSLAVSHTLPVGSIPNAVLAMVTGTAKRAPRCWNTGTPSDFNATRTQLVPSGGATLGTSFVTSAAGVLMPLVCDLPAGSSANAQLSYFDTKRKTVVLLDCGSVNSPALGGPFTYSGAPPSCSKSAGTIKFGVLRTAAGEAGPVQFVGNQSCLWNDSPYIDPGNPSAGRKYEGCSRNTTSTGSQLIRVRLYPDDIQVTGAVPQPSAGATLPSPMEVVCGP